MVSCQHTKLNRGILLRELRGDELQNAFRIRTTIAQVPEEHDTSFAETLATESGV
jgi:hypothetical protein|tara:strand:- start:11926 stop:12090 length:165 start_codon:yes stop_codon:yes gene_type:complete